MRDPRIVAEHRGGSLTPTEHKQLILWAKACAEHILPLWGDEPDKRLTKALQVAQAWADGKVPTGDAMKASLEAHAAAREAANPVATAVARSVGHAVATAHMADHSLGGALYGLKAVKLAGQAVEPERQWQMQQLHTLPPELVEIVLSQWMQKEKAFKLE